MVPLNEQFIEKRKMEQQKKIIFPTQIYFLYLQTQ